MKVPRFKIGDVVWFGYADRNYTSSKCPTCGQLGKTRNKTNPYTLEMCSGAVIEVKIRHTKSGTEIGYAILDDEGDDTYVSEIRVFATKEELEQNLIKEITIGPG